tara:strand:+ start:4022 stop:4183 length:162 start_codon:yes stop_codon:yes gene_type:complete
MKQQPEIKDIEISYLLDDIKQIKEFDKERWEEKHVKTEEELFLEIYNKKYNEN